MGSHDVLNAEIRHFNLWVPYFFNALRVPACCLQALFFTFSPRAHHSSRGENQSGRSGLSDPHDSCCEALRFVFDVLAATRDVSQIKVFAIKVCCRYDILEFRHVLLRKWRVKRSLYQGLGHYSATLVVLNQLRRALVLDLIVWN